jgi:hypothetical protein
LDALSLSPDQKFCAVGGREVFKIVNIDQQKGFSEKLNLKKGKYGQLNKTIVDLKWVLILILFYIEAPQSSKYNCFSSNKWKCCYLGCHTIPRNHE